MTGSPPTCALPSSTIGILLCAGRNDNVVRYALASATTPLAVADYTYDTLPPAVREAIPSSEQLGTAVTAALRGGRTLTAGVTAPTAAAALSGEGTLTVGDEHGQNEKEAP